MSFGFSVGDIVLLGQLSYSLYSTITAGRRGAGRDLQELGDVLFGLRCALDHLGKVANDISASTSTSQDSDSIEMRQKLNLMIDSCGTSLQELDNVTQKYRERVKPAENDAVHDDTVPLNNRVKKGSLARFKQSAGINWMKIRWDMERQSLREYRDKLQSHTDAINIVLNTFLWSTTHRIESDSKSNATKVQGLLNQTLQSNKSLLNLVKEVHSMLLTSETTALPQPVPPAENPQLQPDALPTSGQKCSLANAARMIESDIHSIDPCFGNPTAAAMIQIPNHAHLMSTPVDASSVTSKPQPSQPSKQITSPEAAPASKSISGLPATIIQLNSRRQSTGSREFDQYKEKHSSLDSFIKPPFLTIQMPTVSQLYDGLTFIFRPFFSGTSRQVRLAWKERESEIVRWIQGFDYFFDLWISNSISSPSGSGNARLPQQNDFVDLLVHLNGSIEKSDCKMRAHFYRASGNARFDYVLDKLQTASKSVRIRKEVEEFQDERDEWRGDYEATE